MYVQGKINTLTQCQQQTFIQYNNNNNNNLPFPFCLCEQKPFIFHFCIFKTNFFYNYGLPVHLYKTAMTFM